MTSIIVRSRSRKVLLAVRQLLERRARFRTGDAAVRPSVTARRFTSSATAAAATDPTQRLAGRSFGSFSEAAQGVLSLLEGLWPGTNVLLGLLDPRAESFNVITAEGDTSFRLETGLAIPLQASFAVLVATEQRPFNSGQTAEPVFGALDVQQTLLIGSHIGVPLQRSDGAPIGSLCALAREPDRYGQPDLELLSVMARLLAQEFESDQTARELRQRAEEYRQFATTDALTGVANRRSFLESLHREWQLSHRGTVKSYILIADLDGLKAANDRFGHTIGDALLTDVAQALTGAARVSDVIGRLGGDEFGVILIGCDGEAEAATFCERARERLAVITNDRPDPVSISAGFHSLSDARSPERAMELADRAMYADKVKQRSPPS